MPLTDDFDGALPTPMMLSVITANGAGTMVPIHGIENLTLPQRVHKRDKYTPISGTKAGLEQSILCSEQSADIPATLTYELAHQMAMDAICGVNGCAITLVGPDGLTIAGTGGIEKVSVARVEDSKHMTADLSLALNAGWTLTDSGAVVTRIAAFTVTMTSGTATIDLTNVGGVNLTGKKLSKIQVTAATTNANAITIATGGTNGYAPISGYSEVLSAGESSTVEPLDAPTVASGVKTLDVTGTGAQKVTVYLEAVAP